MSDRIHCCVPFCRRTTKDDGHVSEFLCSNHWPTISPHLRRRESKLRRLYKRRFGDYAFWHFPAGSPKRIEALKLRRLYEKAWERCKSQAIERAAGI